MTESNPVNWAGLADIVHRHQRFLLTSHIRPDCDALGSELGMAHILESLGKQVTIVNGQITPPNLQFIDPQNKLQAIGKTISAEQLADTEVVIVLDTSAWAQLGDMADVIRGLNCKKVIVDHHVGEDDLNAEPFKNTKAEATGRLVLEFAEHLGVPLTAEFCTPVFAALATDTGWFRFGSTTAYTYRCAATLVKHGANPAVIYGNLYEQETLARLQLRGRILARTLAELDGRLVHTYCLQSDFAETGAHAADTEDVINLTLAISGTQVAVILVELRDGGFKISFRSRTPQVDCSKLAGQFNGGGHKAAAGATVHAPFEQVQRQVLDAVRAAMR